MGRPTADQLSHRCTALNAKGHRCGSPALDDLTRCAAHLPKESAVKRRNTVERILALGDKALTRAEQIIERGNDADAAKVIRMTLDRIAPVAGQNALVINVNGPALASGGTTASDLIRERLQMLAAKTTAAEISSVATVSDTSDDDVWEAELVPDPVPVVQPPAPKPAPRPARMVPPPEPEEATVIREQGYGIPRVTSRPADLDRLAGGRTYLLP